MTISINILFIEKYFTVFLLDPEFNLKQYFFCFLLNFPLFCLILIFFLSYFFKMQVTKIHNIALYLSGISFLLMLFFLSFLNKTNTFFQIQINLKITPLIPQSWLEFGVDYISMSLMVLTNLFIYLCIFAIRSPEIRGKFLISELINKLFFIQWGLLCAFSAFDLLSFFIFFEATLIPIFMIILQGGSRERKTRAGYLIAIYTLFGSIFMLYNIFYLFNKYGTTNYLWLYGLNISLNDQKILWITFFLTFAAKIPVFPFHIWLPEAHVEAPTIGSVLLAALLLKLGIFGLLRFGLPLFAIGQEYFKYYIIILTICSFFYINLIAIRQIDIKKIIAYSSIVHMNVIVLGILCLSIESLDGAIYQMLAHGLVSGALFFCIGIIYERFKSRFLWYYGGLSFIMPLYSLYLFLFTLANISFPLTANFVGEMLLFIGICKDNFFIGIFGVLSMFWGVIYSIWSFNRICFGNLNLKYTYFEKQNIEKNYFDIDKKDLLCLTLLFFLTIFTGIYSNSILTFISLNTTNIFNKAIFLFENINPTWKTKIIACSPNKPESISLEAAQTLAEIFSGQITTFELPPIDDSKVNKSENDNISQTLYKSENGIISQTLNKIDAIWEDLTPWQRILLWSAVFALGFYITDSIEKSLMKSGLRRPKRFTDDL